jgi:hypothetical protein
MLEKISFISLKMYQFLDAAFYLSVRYHENQGIGWLSGLGR